MTRRSTDPYRRARKLCYACGKKVHSRACIPLPVCPDCRREHGSRASAYEAGHRRVQQMREQEVHHG